VITSVSQPMVNDQRCMSTRSLEGGNPYNIDLKTLRVAPEQSRFHEVKKPVELKQQPSDAELKVYRQPLRKPRETAVYKNPIQVPRSLPRRP
jgi:hypothetical protein